MCGNYSKFNVNNFVPRKGVMARINHSLDRIVDLAPSDSNCTATIDRVGDIFVFEITIRTYLEFFHAKLEVDTKRPSCRDRMWQIESVNALCEDVRNQIRDWHGRRCAA